MARRRKRSRKKKQPYRWLARLVVRMTVVLIVCITAAVWPGTHTREYVQKLRDAVRNAYTGTSTAEQPNVAARVEFNGTQFDTYTVDLAHSIVRTYWKDSDGKLIGSLARLRAVVESDGSKLLMGTNAGIFTEGQIPEGIFVQDGVTEVALNTRDGTGNFYLKPNGVFYIDDAGAHISETSAFARQSTATISLATQSGPLLVLNGEFHKAFIPGSKNLNIRSGVGVIDAQHVVFAISDQPVSLYDFAAMFRDKLHCRDALYLDGAISQMYLPELNRTDEGGEFAGMIGVTAIVSRNTAIGQH